MILSSYYNDINLNMEKKSANISIEGQEMVRKTARKPKKGSSSVVYLPPDWDGKEVVIIRIDD